MGRDQIITVMRKRAWREDLGQSRLQMKEMTQHWDFHPEKLLIIDIKASFHSEVVKRWKRLPLPVEKRTRRFRLPLDSFARRWRLRIWSDWFLLDLGVNLRAWQYSPLALQPLIYLGDSWRRGSKKKVRFEVQFLDHQPIAANDVNRLKSSICTTERNRECLKVINMTIHITNWT